VGPVAFLLGGGGPYWRDCGRVSVEGRLKLGVI